MLSCNFEKHNIKRTVGLKAEMLQKSV